MLKISIITVCLNSVKTIEQTIRSVIMQNYDNIEYIIIDGGSTDGTMDIICKYENYLSNWISEPDNGIYDAMNKGLKACTGDIVAFLNSDDWYDSNVLKRVNSYFEENDVDIVSGKTYTVYGEVIKRNTFAREKDENVFFSVIYHHPALFAKKCIFEKTGYYNTAYKIAADTDWIIRAYSDGAKILKVDDYFTYFRDGGLSSRKVYESQVEQYRAALDCAEMQGNKELVERIKVHYTQVLENISQDMKVEDALTNHIASVKKLFDLHKHYYIWGAGIRGKKCLKIMEQLELLVDGFIDSSEKTVVDGYLVISPSRIDMKHIICITPKGYEREIEEFLIQMGMPVCNIVFYTDFMNSIAEFGNLQEVDNDEES